MAIQRTFPVIPEVSRSVQDEFRKLRTALYDTQDKLTDAQSAIQNLNAGIRVPAASGSSVTNISNISNLSQTINETVVTGAGGGNPNVTQLIGLLAQAQRAFIPEYSAVPPLVDPASQNGSLISVGGVLYRFNGDSQPGEWQVQVAVQAFLGDTYANWTSTLYPPANYPVETQFRITDWNVIYVVRLVAGVDKWVYQSGVYEAALASLPTTGFTGAALGANDTGLRFFENAVYAHQLQWTGSAWSRGPEDLEHSDTFHEFGAAPSDIGWHNCDGTSQTYLKYDGTTASRTLPDLATAAYAKSTKATYTPTLSAPGTPTFAGTSSGAGVTVQALLGGTAVVPAPFTPAGTLSLPSDPVENFALIKYYRR